MSGSPKKLAALRQGHGAATTDVALRHVQDEHPIPIAPRRLTKRSRQRWVDLWKSPVARAWDSVGDVHLVERYIRAVDEYEKVMPVFEKTRLVKGSTGQIVLNPLGSYITNLQAVMKVCETELGLTPMSRNRLGITIGEAQLTAMELNRRLNTAPMIELAAHADESPEDVWEAEWEAR